MPALIDLRRRIKSIRNTQQITMAMKNVATAKFKKAQRVVLESRPYWHHIPGLTRDVAAWAGRVRHPLLEARTENRVTGLVITSDKGLCGAFNSNLMERALEFFQEKAETSQVRLVVIGKKAVTFFRKHPYSIDRTYSDQIHTLTRPDLDELADYFIREYVYCRTDAVYIAYNEFKSILAPRVTVTRLLPLVGRGKEGEREAAGDTVPLPHVAPDWEPGEIPILDSLLPVSIRNQIRHVFFESFAAEQAARMMAMDSATKNAGDLINDLTLVLNKIRQASITKELLEIISAVEAVANK